MTKEEVYDQRINPLMAQIIAICKEHKIPLLASFTLDYEEGLLCTTALWCEDWQPAEVLRRAERIITGSTQPQLKLTTKNERGEITNIETIQGA